jgi:hypothetical protein
VLCPGRLNGRDPGGRQAPGDRPVFSGLVLLDGQKSRRSGSGIPSVADRTDNPIRLRGCPLLQNLERSTVHHQGGPLVVVGVREDSNQDLLGARVTNCEHEEFWSGLFEDSSY